MSDRNAELSLVLKTHGAARTLDKTTAASDRFGLSLDRNQKRLNRLSAATERHNRQADRHTASTRAAAAAQSRRARVLQNVEKRQSRLAASTRQSTSENKRHATSTREQCRATEKLEAKTKRLESRFDRIGKRLGRLIKFQDRVTRSQRKAEIATRRLDRASGGLFDRFGRGLRTLALVATAYLSVAAGIGAIQTASGAALDLDRINIALEQATGSAQGAASAYGFVEEQVDRLGIGLVASLDGFTKLAAATRGTALAGQETREVWLGLAEAAAALKLPAEQVEGALRAVVQIASKGKVQAEELRGQLGERVPGAFQVAARAMNLTTAELDKQLELGKVYAEDFLPKFAAQLRKEFGGNLERALAAPQAQFERLRNEGFRLAATVGNVMLPGFAKLAVQLTRVAKQRDVQELLEDLARSVPGLTSEILKLALGFGADLLPALGKAADTLRLFLVENRDLVAGFGKVFVVAFSAMVEVAALLSRHLKGLLAILAGVATAFAVLKIGGVIAGFWALVKASTALGVAQNVVLAGTIALEGAWNRLTVAMARNPIGIVAVALAALVSVLGLVAAYTGDSESATSRYHQELEDGRPTIAGLADSHERLALALERETEKRNDLLSGIRETKERLEELKPLADQMAEALEGGDQDRYRDLAKQAGALGVALKGAGKGSAFESVNRELKLLEAQLASSEASYESNAAALKDLESDLAATVEERVKSAVRDHLTLKSQHADLKLKIEETTQAIETFWATNNPTSDRAVQKYTALATRLRELSAQAAQTEEDIGRLNDRILGMADEVRDKLTNLIQAGDLGGLESLLNALPDDLFGKLFPDETREQFLAFQRAMQEAYDAEVEAQRKIRLAREAAEEATKKQIERYLQLKASITAATTEILGLADEYDRANKVSKSLADSTEVENRLRSKASKLTKAQRDGLRLLLADQVQAERLLEGSAILASLRLQEEAHHRLVAAASESSRALAAATVAVELEAEAHQEAEGAAESQERAITGLLRSLRSLDVLLEGQTLALDLEADVAGLEAYVEALKESPLAAEELNRALGVQRDILAATEPLHGQLEVVTGALTERRKELADAEYFLVDSSSNLINGLREEIRVLELEEEQIESLVALFERLFKTRDQLTQEQRETNFHRDRQQEVEDLRFYKAELDKATLSEKLLGTAVENANIELEVRRRVMEAARQGIKLTTQEVRELVEEELRLGRSNEATGNLSDRWLELGSTIASVLSGIDAGLGETIGALIQATRAAISAIQAISQAKADGDLVGQAIGGYQLGSAVGQAGNALGAWDGDRGTGRYGQNLGGDYGNTGAEIGGTIGGLFGPGWAALGAAIGGVLGGLLERTADSALAVFSQAGDRLTAVATTGSDALRDPLMQMVAVVQGIFDDLQLALGSEITISDDFELKIVGDLVEATVNGITRAFEGETAIEDAIAFAISQALNTADFGEATGTATATALSTGSFESLDELSQVLDITTQIDRLAQGLPILSEWTERVRDTMRLRQEETALLLEHGLALSDALRLQNQRLALIREEIDALYGQILGVSEYLNAARAVQDAVTAYNQGLAAEAKSRLSARDDLLAQIAAAEESDRTVGELVRSLGGLDAALQKAEEQSKKLEAAGITQGVTLKDQIRAWQDLTKALPDLKAELEAVELELEDLPDKIDTQRIADAFNAGGLQASLDLIGLLRQVHGQQFMAAEEQRAQAALFQLQLAANIGSVQALLAATSALSDATRALLAGILAEAERTLAGLSSGEITFTPAASGGSSGTRSDNGAAQRQQEREDIRREMERLHQAASGVKDSTLDLLDAFRDFDEWVDNAERLGIAEEQIAQARADQAALDLRSIREPHEESIRQRGESDLATELRQQAEAFDTALQNALLFAQREAERLGVSLEEVFGPLKELILEDFAGGLADQMSERIEALVEAGDAEGLADLASDWDAFLDSLAETPDLLAAIQDQLPELADQIEEAFAQIRASALESLGADLGLDEISAFSEQLAEIRDRVAEAIEVLELANASEEELAQARDMGARAISNLIAAELDRFRALAGLDEAGDNPIDRFRALQSALDELLANLAEAGAPLADIAAAFDIFAQGAERLRQAELDRLDSALGLETGESTIADKVGEADEALASAVANLTEMGASEAELAEARMMHAEAIANLRAEQDLLLQSWRDAGSGTSVFVKRLQDLEAQTEQARIDAAALASGVSDLVKKLQEIDEASRQAKLGIGRDMAQALVDFGVQIPGFETGMLRMEHAMLKTAIATYAASVSAEDFLLTFGMSFGELLADLDRVFEEKLAALEEGQGNPVRVDFSVDIRPIDDTISDLQKKFLEIEANVNSFIDAVDDIGTDGVMREAQQFKRSYQEVLDQVMELPNFMQDDLLPQLQDAYERGFQAIVDKAKEPLRNLLDEFETGSESGIGSRDQLELQRKKVRDLEAAAAGGDLNALAQLEVEARKLLELNDLVNAGGRAGGAIRDEVRAIIERTLGIEFSPDDIEIDAPEIQVQDLIKAPVVLQAQDLIVAPISAQDILGSLFSAPAPGRDQRILAPISSERIYSSVAEPRHGRGARNRPSRRSAADPLPSERSPRLYRSAANPIALPAPLPPALHVPPPPPPPQAPPRSEGEVAVMARQDQRKNEEALRREMAEMRRFLEEQARKKGEQDEELLALVAQLLGTGVDASRVLERLLDKRAGR